MGSQVHVVDRAGRGNITAAAAKLASDEKMSNGIDSLRWASVPRLITLPDRDVLDLHDHRWVEAGDRPAAAKRQIRQHIHWLTVLRRCRRRPEFMLVKIEAGSFWGDQDTELVKAR